MASILNADDGVVSGSAGLKSTADSSGVLALQTNGTTAVTVTAAGSVGIGNTSPQALFHVGSVIEAPGFGTTSQMTYVNGTSQPEVLVRQTTNDVVVSMYADSTGGAIRTATNHPLIFVTNNSERMRIDSAGNVGIGTSSPASFACLGVNKAITTGSVNVSAGFSDAVFNTLRITHASGSLGLNFDDTNLIFQSGGTSSPTTRMNLTSTGNLGIGTTSPAVRLSFGTQFVGNNGHANAIRLYDNGEVSTSTTSNSYGFGMTQSSLLSYTAGTGGDHVFYGANTERLRITSAGLVGIGTSSPSGKLDVNGGVFISPNTAGKNTFTFTTNASNDGRLLIKSNTTDKVDIQANGTSYFEGGTVRFISTISVGNSTPSTSGAGITFPATQSASSDANTLDDYEEGTFTPTYNAGYGSFTSITYGLQSGKYTKVGNMVSINIYIYTSAVTVGTANTAFTMPGLPFTASADSACSLAKLFSWNFGAVTKPINSSLSGTVIYFFNGAYDDTFSSGNYVFGFQGGTADRHFINLTSTYFV